VGVEYGEAEAFGYFDLELMDVGVDGGDDL
jgi:hypothetical protein